MELWSAVPGMYMVELWLTDRGRNGCVLGRYGGIVRTPGASIAALATLESYGFGDCALEASQDEGERFKLDACGEIFGVLGTVSWI